MTYVVCHLFQFNSSGDISIICVVVARFFLSRRVRIKVLSQSPGQASVTILMAAHPSCWEVLVLPKVQTLFALTPAYIRVASRRLIPASMSCVNKINTFRRPLVLFSLTSTNSILFSNALSDIPRELMISELIPISVPFNLL